LRAVEAKPAAVALANRTLIYHCHRGGQAKASTVAYEHHRPLSKKVDCPYNISVNFVRGDDGYLEVEVSDHNGHFNHTPGDRKDLAFLKLGTEDEEKIADVSLFVSFFFRCL